MCSYEHKYPPDAMEKKVNIGCSLQLKSFPQLTEMAPNGFPARDKETEPFQRAPNKDL